MKIVKIAVTGGPCGGKTSAMSWIRSALPRLGYTVLTVPDTAEELTGGGVDQKTCGKGYWACRIGLQTETEKVFERAAATAGDKVLIVCDGGALDALAYAGREAYLQALADLGLDEAALRDGYAAAFHLTTAARGAEGSFRGDSAGEAAALDDRLRTAWSGCPHFRVIDNSTGFEGKMRRLIGEIAAFLGEGDPCEIERKFLIQYPDIQWLESAPGCRRVEIVQTYLRAEDGDEVRVRRRETEGRVTYCQTIKRRVSGIRRVEIERELTGEEYRRLLDQADPARRQIRKTRYCLPYGDKTFEIDIYPFWTGKAVVEIELSDENAQVIFPEALRVIREVTGEEGYTNAALARIE